MVGRNVRWKKFMASGCSGVKKSLVLAGKFVVMGLKGA
jgi:hypothetical protein